MVEYITENGSEVCDPAFADKVKKISNADLDRCYQCYTCTAGCPVAYAMDYYPHQVMRMVQLGVREKLLSCSTIWLCAACETCNTRCPNGVELVNVMDTLREMAIEEGVKVKEEHWAEGKPHGTWTVWDDGKIKWQNRFEHGKPEGKQS